MNARTLGALTFLLVGLYLVFSHVLHYVLPFALGLLLAFILEPLVIFLSERTRMTRAAGAAVIVLALVVGVGYLLTWSVTRIAAELTDLYKYLPQYYGEFNRVVGEILRIAGDISSQLPEPLANVAQEQWTRLSSLLSAIVTGAGGVMKTLPTLTVTTIFTFLSAYFLIKDRDVLKSFLESLVPAETMGYLKSIETDVVSGIAGFIRAQSVLIVLTMLFNVVALSLLGSRYAVALGLILAVLDVLPVIGPGLIYLPWMGYHLVWGQLSYGLWLLALYGSVSLLRQVLQTHVVGKEMGLHPLVTLVSLYAGVRLFGPTGLVYGPITAILLKALWASGAIPRQGGAAN